MEYILRIIMDKADLQVCRLEVQHTVPNPFSRGVRYDVLGGDLPIYHINRHIEELNYKPYGDGSQIIYVNGAYEVKDGEEKTALMTLIEDFRCANADNMKSEVLAARMRQIKNSEEEMSDMCKEVEQFAEKKAMERTVSHIRNMMKNLKLTAETAMEALEIPKSEYPKYMAML